jgi:hypothetical protein
MRHIPFKLIVVEGIMGSGKTTTTTVLAEQLAARGTASRAIWEGMDQHPVQTSDPEGFGSVDAWMQARLQRWSAFAEDVLAFDGVTVLDGQLYHECVDSLLYYDVPPEAIVSFIGRLEAAVSAANPLLIHLFQADVGRAIRDVFRLRGEGWSQWQVEWKVHSRPYCVNRSLTGVDGFIELYRAHRRLADQLFADSTMGTLAIDTSAADWDRYLSEIDDFLEE